MPMSFTKAAAALVASGSHADAINRSTYSQFSLSATFFSVSSIVLLPLEITITRQRLLTLLMCLRSSAYFLGNSSAGNFTYSALTCKSRVSGFSGLTILSYSSALLSSDGV